MRVLITFVLVSMIAGILGGPIAQEPDQTRRKDLQRIQLLQRFVDTYDIQPLDLDPIVAPEQYKIKCRTLGGKDAENAAVEGAETFLNSFKQLTNKTQLELETAADALHGGLDSAIATTCNWALTTTSLVEDFKLLVGQCWRPEEHTSFNLVQNTERSVLQYVCHDNGRDILTFLATGGEDCMTSSNFEIDSCIRTSFSSDTSIVDSNGPPNLPWELPIVTLNTQFCSEFQTLQKCIVGVLKRCQNLTPAHQINGLFNVVKRSSGCEELIKAQI